MKKGSYLTVKQKRFCEKYVELGNKIEAYRQSYNAERMTLNSINSAVQELMKKALITNYIKEIQEKNQKEFSHTISESLKLDFEMVENYKENLAVLRNPKATKKQIEVAERVLRFIGAQGFNAAQDRIAKKLGYYEKDKPIPPPPGVGNTSTVNIYQLPDNGRN